MSVFKNYLLLFIFILKISMIFSKGASLIFALATFFYKVLVALCKSGWSIKIISGTQNDHLPSSFPSNNSCMKPWLVMITVLLIIGSRKLEMELFVAPLRQEGTDELEHCRLQIMIMTDLINVRPLCCLVHRCGLCGSTFCFFHRWANGYIELIVVNGRVWLMIVSQ